LTVALSSDEFNFSKGKEAKFSWEQRKLDLEGVRYVDDIISEDTWEQKVTDVTTRDIDVFTIGDDWVGEFDFLKEHCDVVYLGLTLDISNTMIREVSTPSKKPNKD
jgi:glycerol-3-phosphate cytidylyltransferase